MRLGLRFSVSLAATCAVALIAIKAPSAQSASQSVLASDALGQMGGGGFDLDEAPGDPALTMPAGVAASRAAAALPLAVRPPYPFFPQAGTQDQDLFTSNYVDLNGSSYDITQPGLDFECTQYSYQGHSGHDSIIDGFSEQAIGVPVFAALDGTVVAVHDGEFDQNTTNLAGRPANFVTLSHSGGFTTQYYHLKLGSVAVSLGNVVKAGTQLGLTGSSGNSSWPHLHFTSLQNASVFEPNAGPCRPGDSYWLKQTPIRRDTHIGGFTYGTAAFSGNFALPYDQAPRIGTYVRDTRTIYFRMSLRSLPVQSSYRLSLRRPDGSTALDNSGSFNNASVGKHSWYWFSRNVTLNATGEWTLSVEINGRVVATAPFSVVDSTSRIVNRAPLPLRALDFDPPQPIASDVTFCRATPAELYRRDPDYDVVRYRYRWFIQGRLVRDVTTAALADAIPAGSAAAGEELRCDVTPRDESVDGSTAVLARTVR